MAAVIAQSCALSVSDERLGLWVGAGAGARESIPLHVLSLYEVGCIPRASVNCAFTARRDEARDLPLSVSL